MSSAVQGGAGLLGVRAVAKLYPARSGPVAALEDCSLEIAAGELHAIVGPSGCGKTTLLSAIAGFHGIEAGEIALDHEPLSRAGQPPKPPGADRIVVFQRSTLFPWRTVLDNVIYGPVAQRRMSRADARVVARQRLAEAGLDGVESRYPQELSSGAQRRVELVRALVNEPKLLLLDEPFRGMDAITRGIMHEALLELYERVASTVLFITHDIEEAVFLGSRVSVMSSRPGRIKATVDVDLPRPRELELTASVRFRELAAEVLEIVRGEARLAFGIEERAAA